MKSHRVITSGQTLSIAIGDEVHILFSESAGAGYTWNLISAVPDGFDITEGPAQVDGAAAIGGPSLREMRIRVLKPTSRMLKWKHYRVWEGPDQAVGDFSVTLQAE